MCNSATVFLKGPVDIYTQLTTKTYGVPLLCSLFKKNIYMQYIHNITAHTIFMYTHDS